jgi:uncharacterized membrane protein YidH (DUF202 family)
MSDPSKAQVRTAMAWQRTALALAVLSTIALKLAMVNHKTLGLVTALIALLGTAILLILSRIRFITTTEPLKLLLPCAIIVTLLGLTTIIQIF